MPKKLREECAADPFYRTCARYEALHDHECMANPLNGRMIEWEHALIFASKQLQKKFAMVPLCWWAHSGPGLVKAINVWIALNRGSDDDLLAISRTEDYFRKRTLLNATYGHYESATLPGDSTGINYGYRVERKWISEGV